jgi:hypothetical protein
MARRLRRLVLVPAGALAVVLLVMAAGGSPARWGPVAGFLGLAALAERYFAAALWLERRRARRLRGARVPWGARLSKPLWITLGDSSLLVEVGAALGAIAAAVGLPGVGLGALLACLAWVGLTVLTVFELSPSGLTFEPAGLRLHLRGASFVVPWTAIKAIERVGPDHMQMISLRIESAAAVIGSTEPPVEAARARVRTYVREGKGPAGQIMMMPWTAGLDGPTLARAIGAAMAGEADQVN